MQWQPHGMEHHNTARTQQHTSHQRSTVLRKETRRQGSFRLRPSQVTLTMRRIRSCHISLPTASPWQRRQKLRLKAVIMVECGLQLTMIFYSIAPTLLIRLRRRPQGRQGSHDAPRLELPRLRREPPQFQDDPSSPPTHLH